MSVAVCIRFSADRTVIAAEFRDLRNTCHDAGNAVKVRSACQIGRDNTLECPFATEYFKNHALMMRSIGSTDTVEGNHNAQAAAFFCSQTTFERSEVGHTEFLFVHIYSDTGTVMFLIVKAHMLGTTNEALFGSTSQEAFTDSVCKHGIFGDVFIVTSVVRRSAKSQTCTPCRLFLEPQTCIPLDKTGFISEFGIEGSTKKRLRAAVTEVIRLFYDILAFFIFKNFSFGIRLIDFVATLNAVNAFVLTDYGVFNAGKGIGLTTAVYDCTHRFVNGETIESTSFLQ